MGTDWVTVPASEVKAGDRVRVPSGEEVIATRIEMNFMGRDGMVALIEDTPDRWFKQPVPGDTEVQVQRGS